MHLHFKGPVSLTDLVQLFQKGNEKLREETRKNNRKIGFCSFHPVSCEWSCV